MAVRVAINGFGRIGRSFFRTAFTRRDLEIVAINDLADIENLAYLLKYDTVRGLFEESVKTDGNALSVGHRSIPVFNIKGPADLPWKELDIDVAVEATGVFAGYEKARAHLAAGARRVVITAPVKDEPPQDLKAATILMGVNDDLLEDIEISSNASCTTNAGSPVMTILHESLGIEKAVLNTVHGYTATQALVDSPTKKDWRRGRAAAQNIVPSTTGAAIATTKALTELEGNFDGVALRVPVVAGSIADITFLSKKNTTVEEVNAALEQASKEERWKEIFSVTKEPLVSSDILGSTHASIADLSFTRVVGENLVKVLAWYDNEVGYAHALAWHIVRSGAHAK